MAHFDAAQKTTFGPLFFEEVGSDPAKWVDAIRVRLGSDAPSDQVLYDFLEAALSARVKKMVGDTGIEPVTTRV